MIGKPLAHYMILEKLGEGGMGVVYKARDTHLDRFVAIKVLPPDKVADPDRKRRFVQEAKAASALNHPNIVTIHDIAQAGGVHFIAMEHIAGKTLAEIIPRHGLPLGEALKYAVQIADALARAHQAGILHRDLKPSNIMVDEHGLVRVLDFGLAKLSQTETGEDAPTRTLGFSTGEGTVVGTAAYMSPEQAEGKKLDSRSDIFSFGAVLYEMVTGQRAFQGDSQMSTLSAVLQKEPAPLGDAIPLDLRKLIVRCLRKDRARRFQHFDDIKVALDEMKEESDSGRLAVVARPSVGTSRRIVVWAGCAIVVAAAAAGWLALRRPAQLQPRVSAFAARVGIEWGPALSPDGKQLAFVWGPQQNNQDVYVQLVDEATPRRLTTDPAFEYSPVWSPDGLRIAFLRRASSGTEILIIPAAGGTERRVHVSRSRCEFPLAMMAREHCGLGWSPDGRFLTIVDKETPPSPNSIFLLDVETHERRKLTTPPSGWLGDGVSVFSPDGRTLAFARAPMNYQNDIYVLPLSDGYQPRSEPRRITSENAWLSGFDWTPDGRSLVYSSVRGGMQALWRVALSGGEPERLTIGSENAYWPTVARHGGRLAYAQIVADYNLWRVAAPGSPGPAAAPLRISHSALWDLNPAFSPDGKKIAWSSNHSGSLQIWVAGSDGSQPARLTDLRPYSMRPQWSPDGQQIAFDVSTGEGRARVYVIGSEGGAPRRLTTGDFTESNPTWSRDGKWVYVFSIRGEDRGVWKVPAGGGSPVLTVRNAGAPVFESFDGRDLFYSRPGRQIWKVAAGGGEPVLVRRMGRRALWSLSTTGIYVLDPDAEGGPEIEFSPLVSGARRETLKLPGEPEQYVLWTAGVIAVSPDGRWIAYEHRDRNDGDVMLVDNFR